MEYGTNFTGYVYLCNTVYCALATLQGIGRKVNPRIFPLPSSFQGVYLQNSMENFQHNSEIVSFL